MAKARKPFVDYLPDWLDHIDLDDPRNYRYQFAVACFHRLRELRAALGPAKAYAEWVIEDKDGVEPKRRIPCCRRGDGRGWQPAVETVFPRIYERSADKWVEIAGGKGGRYYLLRFNLGVNVIEPYSPQSPEWIEQQAAKRRAKQLQKECGAMPLFRKEIMQEAVA